MADGRDRGASWRRSSFRVRFSEGQGREERGWSKRGEEQEARTPEFTAPSTPDARTPEPSRLSPPRAHRRRRGRERGKVDARVTRLTAYDALRDAAYTLRG
jgi:hypothetical protein